ncbi:Acetylornithine aminotransferase [Ephemeroptericola cinctiostellae]|uniref:Acetylornithine aminotransferase n=1 Tax=Ephemeroptericola cinctiostellae TaxID=2268024 RepID=A0A345DCJ4_9BURK|nr:aspartate aminotransferase family protein [Ephemeroptericola cinctiostellae]AXF86082.1 Acetylornithine aminotransferase [Ephemeroptericola cinctiostellae]
MSNSASHLMPIFNRLPVAFAHGNGVRLTDVNGKVYLDALSGIAVNGLGHNHPRLVQALQAQVAQVIHVSNLYDVPQQHELANALAQLSGMDEVFFSNSGAESNEGAIKLARLYGQQQGKKDAKIIVMSEAFHGRTLATLTATGNAKVQKGFEPLVSGFVRVPYNDVEAIKAYADDESVVAVMLEVVQGEGGIRCLNAGVLTEIRALCDAHGWLLILDEVQTGIARTGKWFAHQHENVKPDVMTLAKGLGSGVPVGAILTSGRATGVFPVGAHGTTFGGNPLAMAAGLATVAAIESDGLAANAERQGAAIKRGLNLALKDEVLAGDVRDIRGLGLMIGIELDRPCGELVKLALNEGMLINVTHDTVVRLLPPLVFSDEDSAELVDRLSKLIKNFLNEAP